MIILRYLCRELLQTTFAVTAVLMVVIMSGRFVKYLADAAAGKIDAGVLAAIMLYRTPGFLELILPLGFLVAILMAYGRLYAEQEMTVLFAAGVSQPQILFYTFLPASFMAILVGLCSLWLTPLGLTQTAEILQQQKQRNEFETMQSGKFQVSQSGKVVNYSENQSQDRQLEKVFIATMGIDDDENAVTIKADKAERIFDSDNDHKYLLLSNGVRHEGRPGQVAYRITQFQTMGQRIEEAELSSLKERKVDAMATAELFELARSDAKAALQWRVSAPLLIFILTFLGLVLSYTTPRRGRYVMLFPTILIYLLYLVFLNAARGAIEEERLSSSIGLWLVHATFFLFSAILFLLRTGQLRRWFNLN